MATIIMTYELVLLQFDPENRVRVDPIELELNVDSGNRPKLNFTSVTQFKRYNALDKVYRPSAFRLPI